MAVMSAGGPTFFHGSFPLPPSLPPSLFGEKWCMDGGGGEKQQAKEGRGNQPPPPLNNSVLPASSRPNRPAPPCRESNGENIFLHPVFYPLPPSFRLCPRYLFPFFATVPAPPPALPSPSRQVPSSSFFSPPSSILLLPLPATTTGKEERGDTDRRRRRSTSFPGDKMGGAEKRERRLRRPIAPPTIIIDPVEG